MVEGAGGSSVVEGSGGGSFDVVGGSGEGVEAAVRTKDEKRRRA